MAFPWNVGKEVANPSLVKIIPQIHQLLYLLFISLEQLPNHFHSGLHQGAVAGQISQRWLSVMEWLQKHFQRGILHRKQLNKILLNIQVGNLEFHFSVHWGFSSEWSWKANSNGHPTPLPELGFPAGMGVLGIISLLISVKMAGDRFLGLSHPSALCSSFSAQFCLPGHHGGSFLPHL